jgi:hypothetical protein
MDDPLLYHHLLAQLRNQRLQVERRKRIQQFYVPLSIAIVTIAIALSLECHTKIINTYLGPFHIRADEFIELAQAFNESRTSFLYTSWNEFRHFIYHKIYLQVELGQENIEYKPDYPPRVYEDAEKRKGLIATFHHVLHLNAVTLFHPNRVFIKMPAYPIKLPFQFSAFSIKTLRCVVRELNVAPVTYISWPDKQDYVSYIRNRYENNYAHFNEVALVRCGIFVGFFIRPKTHIEKAYASMLSSASWFEFKRYDIALDVTRPYRAYAASTMGFIACVITIIALLLSISSWIVHRQSAQNVDFQVPQSRFYGIARN